MSNKLTMLVVDDSNIIRSKIKRSVPEDIVEVVATARNGRQAVSLFEYHQPDLVTMDITMPEMDGIECIELISKMNKSSLILIISALSDKATAIEALRKGAHGFLCKPFSDDSLSSALKELIRGAQQ